MKKPLALLLAVMMIFALLTGCTGGEISGGSEQSGSAAESVLKTDMAKKPSEGTYTIRVKDADDSAPLSGAMVQFCSDTQCLTGNTGTDGTVSFEAAPGDYTVHILKTPEGYEATEEELTLTAEDREAAFSLHRSDADASDRQAGSDESRGQVH